VLIFLAAFAVGLVMLSQGYLMPALRAFFEAKQQGDKAGAKAISATSALLLAVILVILVTGMILTFRVGRMFFPRGAGPRTRTKYVDVWAESGKRLEVPKEEE
jgi:type II secretory pathway component PulF